MISLEEPLKKHPNVDKKRINLYIQIREKHSVDWEKLSDDLSRNGYDENFLEELWLVLKDMGILSFQSKGNYLLAEGGNALNPRVGGFQSPLYFTEKREAQDYNRFFCKGKFGRIFMGLE